MSGSIYNDEVLDLREMILILWRRKWLVLGIPLMVGGLILLVNSTLVPKRYQTTAIITITDRNLWTTVEIKSIMQLAESGKLRKQTYELLGVSTSEGEQYYTLSAETDGRGQLLLHVTSLDPNLAAEVANTWAGVVSTKIIDLFGGSELSLVTLEEEVATAGQIWAEAQTELEDFREESSLQIYPAQIGAAQSALEDNFREINRNRLLLSDIQTLAFHIQTLDPKITQTSGIELSIINLQARATAVEAVAPIQMEVDEPTISLEGAVSILQGLQSALELQNQKLEEDVVSLKDEIADWSLALEEELNIEAQLELNRDQAQVTLAMVLADLEEEKVLQDQERSNLTISAEALPPQAPVRSNRLTMASFASLSAAVLTILGTLFQAWWVKKE